MAVGVTFACADLIVSPKKFVAVTLTEYVPFVLFYRGLIGARGTERDRVGVPGVARFADEPAII